MYFYRHIIYLMIAISCSIIIRDKRPGIGTLSDYLWWQPSISIKICQKGHVVTRSALKCSQTRLNWIGLTLSQCQHIHNSFFWIITEYDSFTRCLHTSDKSRTKCARLRLWCRCEISFWYRSFELSAPQRAWRPMRVQAGGCTDVSRLGGKYLFNFLGATQLINYFR